MIEYKYNTNTIQIQYKYYNSKTRLTDTGIPEVRVTVKRDLIHSQKRPNTQPKETQYTAKRDLIHSQKRPT